MIAGWDEEVVEGKMLKHEAIDTISLQPLSMLKNWREAQRRM
jgi:hypothetical protein